MPDIILENSAFRLTLGEDASVKGLLIRKNDEECVYPDEGIRFFSVTQERPFNNEVKLAHPNKRTVWQAESLRYEDGILHAAFETVPVKARIRVDIREEYMVFTLDGFTVSPEDYGGLCMDTPPVAELRLCALPLNHRENFGEWLNVCWDEKAAVTVAGSCPEIRIDSEKRKSARILTADLTRDAGFKGSAVLIAAERKHFLDVMDCVERDLGLPRGVENRRHPLLNASVYWTGDISLKNADEHIALAKKGGFRLMLIYYTAFFREKEGYSLCGDYDFKDEYPGGLTDVKTLADKVKAAGILPGIHFLQTHIGLKSRYVTPKADRRLHHTRRFTLSKSIGTEDTVIYVDESPLGSPMNGKCRYLQIGTEIISYAGYTDRRPYCFTGCVRGAFTTDILPHDEGSSAGTLDISEFGGTSCYIDQDTDLQDEIAQKIADVYNCGFRFCYMDGSEGTNAPHARHVPGAQMRVYSLLREKPLFTEGAAKAHFSWHFQAGGNAFDVFPPEVFKRMIARFPLEEAPRMKQDFTRLDFGWWAFRLPEGESEGTQADQYEYGTSKAAAWDCPATMQTNIERFRLHPRTDDILEVMRRWEEARCTGLLTDEVKERLRDPESEFTLLRDGSGSLVLCKYERLETCAHITAYAFAYEEKTCAVYWHNRSDGRLKLPLAEGSFLLRDELCGNEVTVENQEGYTVIPAGGKRYIVSDISPEKLRETFERAVLL